MAFKELVRGVTIFDVINKLEMYNLSHKKVGSLWKNVNLKQNARCADVWSETFYYLMTNMSSFWIWCQQQVSKKLEQEQQKAGKVKGTKRVTN